MTSFQPRRWSLFFPLRSFLRAKNCGDGKYVTLERMSRYFSFHREYGTEQTLLPKCFNPCQYQVWMGSYREAFESKKAQLPRLIDGALFEKYGEKRLRLSLDWWSVLAVLEETLRTHRAQLARPGVPEDDVESTGERDWMTEWKWLKKRRENMLSLPISLFPLCLDCYRKRRLLFLVEMSSYLTSGKLGDRPTSYVISANISVLPQFVVIMWLPLFFAPSLNSIWEVEDILLFVVS